MQHTSPTSAKERIKVLDILRGFTIGGILFANILLFNGYFGAPSEIVDSVINKSKLDHWLLYAIQLLIHGKFYYIFSFLFGLGFGVQLDRMAQRNINFTLLYSRRLIFLFLFGMLHAVFFFYGDIIRYYALLGFILLLLRKRSDKFIFYTACFFLFSPVILKACQQLLLPDYTFYDIIPLSKEYILTTYTTGSYSELLSLNWEQIKDHALRNIWSGRFLRIFGLFLFGFFAARKKIFHNIQANIALFKRLFIIGLIAGVSGGLVRVNADYDMLGLPALYTPILQEIVYFIAVPAMSMLYLATIVLLCMKQRYFKILNTLFAAVGKTALTNYILQSVICAFIFDSYGLGLYAQLSLSQSIVIVIVIYSAQIICSSLWLKYFRFGPLEWLWRTLTYLELQPIRKLDNRQ